MLVKIFAWSCWVNVVSSAGMAGFVLFSRPLTKLKILWAGMCLAVAVWSVGLGVMVCSRTHALAILGIRILYCAAPLIPVFFLHTVSTLVRKRLPVAVTTSYFSAILMEVLNFSGLLCGAAPAMGFSFYTQGKPLYFLFVFHLYGLFILTGFYLWRAWHDEVGLRRRQMKLLFWGTILGFTGGQTTVPLVYGIQIFPLGNVFVPLYVFLVGYGMLQYQFLDFRIAARKLALVVSVFFGLLACILPLGWSSLRSIANAAPDLVQDVVILAILLAIILSAGPVIYSFISYRAHWLHNHAADGLTHELRSPLANIQSSLELLSSNNEKPSAAYLAIIGRNVTRLNMVITNLLHMSGADCKVGSLKQELLEIGPIIERVCGDYREQSEMKGVHILIDPPFNPVQAWVDPDKLQLVIANLVSNAIKFSERGTVKISFRHVDGQIELSISDEGIGIPAKDLDQIFQRFFQKARGTQGTGLGLTVAKELIEAHGGRIWAESDGEGSGTTIRLTLPNGST